MYTYSEIQIIFNSCLSWQDLEAACKSFEYLFKEDWIKSGLLYNAIIELSDEAFRRIENL